MCGGEKLCVMVCNCVDVIFYRCSLVESCVWILQNQVEVIVSVATISAAAVSLLLWLLCVFFIKIEIIACIQERDKEVLFFF